MSDASPVDLSDIPYWKFLFRPAGYERMRIQSPHECLEILERIAVRAGGWRYPFVSKSGGDVSIRGTFAQASIDSGEFREFVRLYQSGQYLCVTAMREASDTRALQEAQEIARYDEPSGSVAPTGGLNIVRLMRLIGVALENAYRLIEALTLSDEEINVQYKIGNAAGLVLVPGTRRAMDELHQAHANIELERQYQSGAVLSTSALTAIVVARDEFAQFGWRRIDDFVLKSIYEDAMR